MSECIVSTLPDDSSKIMFCVWLITSLGFIFFPRFSNLTASIVITHTIQSIIFSYKDNVDTRALLNDYSHLYVVTATLTFLVWSAIKSFYNSFA